MSRALSSRIAAVLAVLGVAATPVAAQDADITVTFATGVEPNGDPWHWVEATVSTFDIIAPKTLVVRASFRTRTVDDRAAGRAGSTVVGLYENREAIPAGSIGKVFWAGALREGKVLGEEWPEPQAFERLESVELAIWGDDGRYEMPCRHSASLTWAKVFDCWLPSPVATQSPHGEDVGIAFADSSALGDRLVHFYPYTLDIAAEELTVLAAFERRAGSDPATVGSYVVCRYGNREAATASGGWRPLYWLGCEEEWPEPQTFEWLGASAGTGSERRGGVEVSVGRDGGTYEMRCEDVSEPGSGRWFACWLPP